MSGTNTQSAQAPEIPNNQGTRFSGESLDALLQAGVQVGGTIAKQRQASGKAAARQARIAACGRKPLFNRKKKAAYNECVAQAQGGGANVSTRGADFQPPADVGSDGGNKTMMYVGIGLGIVVLGVVGFILYKKFIK